MLEPMRLVEATYEVLAMTRTEQSEVLVTKAISYALGYTQIIDKIILQIELFNPEKIWVRSRHHMSLGRLIEIWTKTEGLLLSKQEFYENVHTRTATGFDRW